MRQKNPGFSLIELLVVIAIIAILAAILFPIFLTAKERGKQSQCISNMRQIGSAVSLYVDDWQGVFPPNRLDPAPSQRIWKTSIRDYVKNRKVYLCPANEGYRLSIAQGNSGLDDSGQFPISYGYNGTVLHEAYVGAGRKQSEIPNASRTIFLLETRKRMPDLGAWCMDYANGWRLKTGSNQGSFQIHVSKRANWLMYDLHAASMTLPQTCVPRNMWGSDVILQKDPGNELAKQSYYDAIISKLSPEYL